MLQGSLLDQTRLQVLSHYSNTYMYMSTYMYMCACMYVYTYMYFDFFVCAANLLYNRCVDICVYVEADVDTRHFGSIESCTKCIFCLSVDIFTNPIYD